MNQGDFSGLGQFVDRAFTPALSRTGGVTALAAKGVLFSVLGVSTCGKGKQVVFCSDELFGHVAGYVGE